MPTPPIRSIFFGTPDFAVPCVRALMEVTDVVQVISQPDRPKGRGLKTFPTPVKQVALEAGIVVVQPTKVRTAAFAQSIRELKADVALVVAYGRILPRSVLDAPRLGCLNVHASLLPRWRGAAPIQWAVASGDPETGVCLMCMDEGMDTGPVLSVRKTPIEPNETSEELSDRLSQLGSQLVTDEVPRFVDGHLAQAPQPSEGVTHASLLDKNHGRVHFDRTAREVHNQVRGMRPWPGAFAYLGDKRVKIHKTSVVFESGKHGVAGSILKTGGTKAIVVACEVGAIGVLELQLDGRKRVEARAFLGGFELPNDARLTPEPR